jgi:hypothetical protein
MSITVHVSSAVGLSYKVYPAETNVPHPWVALTVGDYSGGANLMVHDLEVLAALEDVARRARQELARGLGLLPSGEPCAYVDVFGSIEWNEHDHDECLEALIDEPIPYMPAKLHEATGTAWERHDDPTVNDNPVMYAEGWL